MKKPEDKQNVFFSGTKIEESHVKLFSKEFNKFHSEEDFFVAKRCIKIDKNGNIDNIITNISPKEKTTNDYSMLDLK